MKIKPFFPKDKKIMNLMERLEQQGIVVTKDGQLVQQLGRFKYIRHLRDKNTFFIGKDRHKGITIIYSKKPIIKKGNGFIL